MKRCDVCFNKLDDDDLFTPFVYLGKDRYLHLECYTNQLLYDAAKRSHKDCENMKAAIDTLKFGDGNIIH